MSVNQDYKCLADRLIAAYAEATLETNPPRNRRINDKSTAQMLSLIISIQEELKRYTIESDLDTALETINLSKIYGGVDAREEEKRNPGLGYEDLIVLEVLEYFKNDFFTWVNKPECPSCHKDGDNIEGKGAKGPPSPNPDKISQIEVYWCKECNRSVEFPRINNARRLLETRKGRCGEWVNCFMLILKAVLGAEARIRYVWNREDHVWCEYFSTKLDRYVHLDPCENAFDNPLLYCENWGKKMSWVFGIGDDYIIDLSSKYITKEKQIPKLSIAKETIVTSFVSRVNHDLLRNYWLTKVAPLDVSEREKYLKLYYDVISVHNKEVDHRRPIVHLKTSSSPQGRQTGSAEWTKSRGEDGQHNQTHD